VTGAPRTLRDAVILPLREFFGRDHPIELLVFVAIYRLGVVVAIALLVPFMADLGFSNTEIGTVTKGAGVAATILGTICGGAILMRLGVKRGLVLFGAAQGGSGLAYWALAVTGHHYAMMVAAIAIENLCQGLGIAAFASFLMSLCDRRFSVSQYALLSSLMSLATVFAAAPCGYLAKHLGWPTYFLLSVALSLPGLTMLCRFDRWQVRTGPGA
jgi:PAT family beta-lactamase induction signal transducer AmpG